MVAGAGVLRAGPPSTLFDRVFENEINIAVFATRAAYERLLFREALKSGAYDLSNARDLYRCVLACMCTCVYELAYTCI